MSNLISWLINTNRSFKQGLMIISDFVLLLAVFILSFSLRLDYIYIPQNTMVFLFYASPLIAIPVFFFFGLYRSIIRYLDSRSIWIIMQAVTVYSLLWALFAQMIEVQGLPRSVIFIQWALLIVGIGGLRFFAQWILNYNPAKNELNIMIYGSGSAGHQLSISLIASKKYNPIAFIDDNPQIQGNSINGLIVIPPSKISDYIETKNVKEIFLAAPSVSRLRRKEIINFLSTFGVLVKSLPSLIELVQGSIRVEDLKQVNVEDLLGRSSVIANKKTMSINITGKVVVVTGAGGSIGSELSKQILLFKPKILILYDISEFSLYQIESQLIELQKNKSKIISILGSVNNKKRLQKIFKKYDVETIYHAAAYKHVPMVEFNMTEGIENNVFGTLSCAQAAINQKVETFVLISTDKAVRPTSIMGSTKRLSEMLLQGLSSTQSITKFTMVRFGNVLDSSGSVIPLFKEQIKSGGPVTVTNPDVVRYFMTIPEAVELIIQAGSMSKGGEVFVLDMGQPVKINDLAKNLIRLSGLQLKDELNPDGDIEIEYTGLRPGEKLFEELLIGENVIETQHDMIHAANEDFIEWDKFQILLERLKVANENYEYELIKKIIIEALPEYKPEVEIKDVLF